MDLNKMADIKADAIIEQIKSSYFFFRSEGWTIDNAKSEAIKETGCLIKVKNFINTYNFI